MAAVTGLILVKRFTYRDDASEEFSNRYHFRGAPPGDDASWQVLAYDIWNVERTLYTNTVSLVAIYGYDSDDPKGHAVYSSEVDPANNLNKGTFPGISGFRMAGDQAALVEWRLAKKNARGKWIYLRKYHHNGFVNSSDTDKLETTYEAALQSYANALAATTMHGGLRPQRYDATIAQNLVDPYVTTRTLKRRELPHVFYSSQDVSRPPTTVCVRLDRLELTARTVYYLSRALQNLEKKAAELVLGSG